MKYHPFILKSVLLALLLAFLVSCDHSKQQKKFTVEDVPDPKKSGGGYVSNPDHLISDATVSELNAKLSELDKAGKVQVAVVLLHSIGENDTRDFVHKLFNYWKIGDKEKNNGLLILMVEDARKLEFETGYGIEADMPDIICFRIQQEYMIPRIKEQNNDAALTDGIKSVASLFNNGNYAYDKLQETPVEDPSLIDPSLMIADSAAPVVEGVVTADSPVDAAPQQFANTGGDPSPGSPASYDSMGEPSFWGIFFWIFISSVMMRVFFGKKVKRSKKNEDPEPIGITSIPNEFLRPRWFGLLLIHIVALATIFHLTMGRHTDVGFLKTCLVYYLVWVLFIHVAILIIMIRAAVRLKGADRHEKWLRLEILGRDLTRARYVFPLPYLWLYLLLLNKRLTHLRNDPYDCHKCLKPMHKLDETGDDSYLDKGQLVEEELHSVDYDVWRCDTCDTQTVLNYTNMRSGLSDCPSCAHKTYKCNKTVTQKRATTRAAGFGIRKYACQACGFMHDYMFVIPKISQSSSSSSSGSSSSSSSSSSSWGGGSSGGGGASSSW